ncbi:hypothetical protein I4U23_025542 [Adineta vaga]|nr:hypothetical protein I4U23_025542 [Adineta vaga]
MLRCFHDEIPFNPNPHEQKTIDYIQDKVTHNSSGQEIFVHDSKSRFDERVTNSFKVIKDMPEIIRRFAEGEFQTWS